MWTEHPDLGDVKLVKVLDDVKAFVVLDSEGVERLVSQERCGAVWCKVVFVE